jgi:hypothetical protein
MFLKYQVCQLKLLCQTVLVPENTAVMQEVQQLSLALLEPDVISTVRRNSVH